MASVKSLVVFVAAFGTVVMAGQGHGRPGPYSKADLEIIEKEVRNNVVLGNCHLLHGGSCWAKGKFTPEKYYSLKRRQANLYALCIGCGPHYPGWSGVSVGHCQQPGIFYGCPCDPDVNY